MQAAAHNKGGFGGVPQSVGKEFVGDAAVKGAGICICAADTGRVLFLKRSPSSSHAGEYDLPGGTAEDADQGDPDLHGREEIVGGVGQLQGCPGPAVAALDQLLQAHFAG